MKRPQENDWDILTGAFKSPRDNPYRRRRFLSRVYEEERATNTEILACKIAKRKPRNTAFPANSQFLPALIICERGPVPNQNQKSLPGSNLGPRCQPGTDRLRPKYQPTKSKKTNRMRSPNSLIDNRQLNAYTKLQF